MFYNLNFITTLVLYTYVLLEYLIDTVSYETFFYYFPFIEKFYVYTVYPYFSFFHVDLHIFLFVVTLHILICILLVIINLICTSEDYQNNPINYTGHDGLLYTYFIILYVFILYFFKFITLQKFAIYIFCLTFFII